MEIWIVNNGWSYRGCSDDFRNCNCEDIEKIFDSEEKAIKWIQDNIRPMVEHRAAVLEERKKLDVDYGCCDALECGNCIACDDIIDLEEVPSSEYLRSHRRYVAFNHEHNETYYYRYSKYEVE